MYATAAAANIACVRRVIRRTARSLHTQPRCLSAVHYVVAHSVSRKITGIPAARLAAGKVVEVEILAVGLRVTCSVYVGRVIAVYQIAAHLLRRVVGFNHAVAVLQGVVANRVIHASGQLNRVLSAILKRVIRNQQIARSGL